MPDFVPEPVVSHRHVHPPETFPRPSGAFVASVAVPEEALLPIPPCEPRPPECPLCHGDTDWQEGWTCENCDVYWPSDDGTPGEPMDERDFEQCGAVSQPYKDSEYANIRDHKYVCVRKVGHKSASEYLTDLHVGIRVDVKGDPLSHGLHKWLVR